MSREICRRSLEQDIELARRTRDTISRALEILQQNPSLDTFLGRKTQEPFPRQGDGLLAQES